LIVKVLIARENIRAWLKQLKDLEKEEAVQDVERERQVLRKS